MIDAAFIRVGKGRTRPKRAAFGRDCSAKRACDRCSHSSVTGEEGISGKSGVHSKANCQAWMIRWAQIHLRFMV